MTAEREAQDAGPAVQVQEGEVPQEDMGAGALPPGPVLPKDEAVLPGDVMPFPPVRVLPANETVLPADEMPFPPVLA